MSLVHSPDFCVDVALEMKVSLYGNRPKPDQWKALSGPICAGKQLEAMGGKRRKHVGGATHGPLHGRQLDRMAARAPDVVGGCADSIGSGNRDAVHV